MNNEYEWNPKQASLVVGTNLSKLIGIEARLGTGTSNDSQKVAFQDVKVESDGYFGGFARLRFAKNDFYRPYILIGYTEGSGTARSDLFSKQSDWSSASYGAGFEFSVFGGSDSTVTMTNVEWIQYYSEESLSVSTELSTINVGITVYFGSAESTQPQKGNYWL